jgi:hypothetical protein
MRLLVLENFPDLPRPPKVPGAAGKDRGQAKVLELTNILSFDVNQEIFLKKQE